MHVWNNKAHPVGLAEMEGRVCYGGLDLAFTIDITAFVLVFPPETGDEKYVIAPRFWIPKDNIDARLNRDHVPYGLRERQGFLQTTEGNVVHYAAIETFIGQLGERFDIREIAFDRWGAVQMSQNFEEAGFTVVPFGQGFKDMSPPSKELMKLALEGSLAHGGPQPQRGWSTTSTSVPTRQATSYPTSKRARRRSTVWWPRSWLSIEPSETAAHHHRAASTTNADYSCSKESCGLSL